MPLTSRQAYRILRLSHGADIEEVKTSFRKLAFELHPDLHPNDPAASDKFRELNEAYVFLRNYLKASPQAGAAGTGSAAGSAREEPRASKEEAARAYQRAKSHAGAEGAQSGAGTRQARNVYFTKEDVLHDLLKDPFARQVFEDIYREVRRHGGRPGATQASRRKVSLRWGEKKMDVDVSQGVLGGFKGWLLRHLDDEQAVYFPRHQLLPGRVLRLTVDQRLGRKPKTVEVRLPADFTIGRAIRLKGLGRRIGPVKGDLYLRIYGK